METARKVVVPRSIQCSLSTRTRGVLRSLFKVLIVQTQHNLSDARMEFMIRDRLSWMRFFGFELSGRMPDENTIRHFRNRLTETGTLKRVMQAFDWQLHKKGYIPMSGQIIDATLVCAPKQRNSDEEREAIKAGRKACEIWPDRPNKAAQKDVDARWTLKVGGKIRHRPDGTALPQIATPVFGYKSHISIDKRYGFIRRASVTCAAAPLRFRTQVQHPAMLVALWDTDMTKSTLTRDARFTAFMKAVNLAELLAAFWAAIVTTLVKLL